MFLKCTTIKSLLLVLAVDDVFISFTVSDKVGASKEAPSIMAYLVKASDADEVVGNRTAVLVYTPEPGFVGSLRVGCDGGIVNSQCVGSVEIVGKTHTVCFLLGMIFFLMKSQTLH